MVNLQLIQYIKSAKDKDLSDTQIISSLKDAGWNEDEINKSMNSLNPDIPLPPVKPPVSEDKQGHGTMWDSFEHILLFISLYAMATSLALILHYFVDKWVPGISSNGIDYKSYNPLQDTLLKGYLATLIVSFPMFSFFFLLITSRTLKYPFLRNLKSRKFLIYFTLVITFIVMLANIITIVYGFLNGNVTINFLLHFLVTIGVAGGIFTYYMNQVRGDRKIYA